MTNALPLGVGVRHVAGIFPICSRINHSCIPNAHHSWNNAIGCEMIETLKDISQGEEITINYTITAAPYAERQAILQTQFGFSCDCQLCLMPEAERRATEERHAEIMKLDNFLGNFRELMKDPPGALENAYTLLKLLEIDGKDGDRISRVYYDAFQLVLAYGDLARAKTFAEKAYEAGQFDSNSDDPLAQRLKSYINDPKQHSAYGLGLPKIWKTTVGMIPKNLYSEAFEMWLWRQDQKN